MKDNEKEVEELAAMVDFYSDRAVAHASFFLAFVFGLFAVLAIAQNDLSAQKSINLLDQGISRALLWAIPYWLLFLTGFYTFLNFSLYATYAQKITEQKICGQSSMHDKTETSRKEARENLILKRFQGLKHSNRKWKMAVIFVIYLAISSISCLLVIGPTEMILGDIASIVIAIALTYDCTRKNERE